MASSSSSVHQWKYDVFLSTFSSSDTEYGSFTTHLHAALTQKQIKTFIDNRVDKGEGTSSANLKAIEESKISVVIFSIDYLTSPWCLDELAKILECMKTHGQMVLPIFYQVNSSDAKEMTGNKYEESLEADMNKLQTWKNSLTEAANLPGWDSWVIRPESRLIEEIVGDILKKLNNRPTSLCRGLVGIDPRIERVESLLCIRSLEVRFVGIWGMGGIGKTTIAEAVFKRNSSEFEVCHFFANIREESERRSLGRLRDELSSKINGKDNFNRRAPNFGFGFAKSRLQRKKVFIVLDDVNSSLQLQELLAGVRQLFGQGSKILVTSRDRQVLKNGVDEIYEIEGLYHNEALQLFSLNAFKQDHPFEDFMLLSRSVIYYAKGNPLALKVLGCFLADKSNLEWEGALDALKRTSNTEMKSVLRLSYDGLDSEDKDIFLDIACFFKGMDVYHAKRILDACEFSVDIGIDVLIDRCLITISNNKLWMHDLLQELGWEIIQEESIEEPGKRTRLWDSKDVCHVLSKDTGTQAVEGIILDMSEIRELPLSSKAFKKMYNLRLLKFYDSDFEDFCRVRFPEEELRFHSDKLRYLHWYRYPSKSLPSNFCPESLVELDLPRSNVEQLWEGVQELVKLKQIDLSYSENLIRVPDLSKAQNLENLNLKGCTNLVEVPPSIQDLNKLEHLNLEHCRSLRCLPSRIDSKFLKTLNLLGCSNLSKFPDIEGNVEQLHLNRTAIDEVPSSVECLTRLVSLNLVDCTRLRRFPTSVCKLKHLRKLNFLGCSKLESFPEISETMESLQYLYFTECKTLTSLPNSICNLKSLVELDLKGTMIEELPSSIGHLNDLGQLDLERCKNLLSLPCSVCNLKSLKFLNIAGCSKLDKLPENLENLESLQDLDISRTSMNQIPSSMTRLKNLERLTCRCENSAGLLQIPWAIGSLSLLRRLVLSGNNFESIPESIEQLSLLEFLDVSCCRRLHSLPELPPRLETLYAQECTSLEIVLFNKHFCQLNYEPESRNVKYFTFSNCFRMDTNTCRNITVAAFRRIQLMTTTSDQLHHEGRSSVKIHFPGSEIPTWFCNQNMGWSVSMELPSNCSQFRGFALCIVIEFEDSYMDRGLVIRCKCHFKTNHGESNVLTLDNWLDWYPEPVHFKSKHLFLWDDPCLEAMESNEEDWLNKYSEASFQFCLLDFEENFAHCCKVKKCGVHLLRNNAKTNRLSEAYEEEEPHPKRLKCLQD